MFQPLNFNGLAGTRYIYSITKQADLLGPMYLHADLAALLQPTVFPTGNVMKSRYINNLGMGMIESLRISYASNPIATILPEWMYVRYRKYLNDAAGKAWRVLSRMDQTIGERDAYAATGGEVFTNLCVPWGDDTSQYYSMCGMASELRVEITIKPLINLLNFDLADPTAAATTFLFQSQATNIITALNLHCECIHLTGAERDTVISNVKSAEGLAKMVEDVQSHIKVLIPSNASPFTYQLRLTNINGPVSTLFWYLEDPKNTSGVTARSDQGGDFPLYPHPGLGTQVGSWSVSSNGYMVVPLTSSFISRYYNHVRWFSSPNAGEYIFAHSFSQNPEIPNANYGSFNFGQLDSPTLSIGFPAGMTNAYAAYNDSQGAYLNVIAELKNFLHEQGGDFSRTFN